MMKVRKINWDPNIIKKFMSDVTRRGLMVAGGLVEAEAKRSMHTGGGRKGGRDAKGRFKRGRGEPSVAPNPPHVQTGTLRASITHAPTKQGTVVVGVGTAQAWYGVIHEFGGRFHPKRPFMYPALIKCKAQFPRLFKRTHVRPPKPKA